MAPYLPLDNAVNLHIMESEPASAPRKHPLLVLHGLLGSSSNFRSIALKGKLAEDRYAAAVDLRNHGYSPHTETMTIEEMAADVAHTIRTKNMQPVHLLGHSLGGKISMALALQEPDLLKSVIVVDIAPVAYSKGTSSQWNVIQQIVETVHNAPVEEMHTRKDMDKHLKNQGIEEPGIRGFLLQNLVRAENNQGFAWRINTETIVTSLSQLSGFADYEGHSSKPALFIRGSKSDYIKDEDVPKIQQLFPHAQVQTIDGAGHWVHAEKPSEFVRIVDSFAESNEH